MTEKDNDILSKNPDIIIFDKYHWGYYVQVPKEDFKNHIKNMEKAGLSPSFIKIIKWASNHGVDWVKFDGDAERYPKKFKCYIW